MLNGVGNVLDDSWVNGDLYLILKMSQAEDGYGKLSWILDQLGTPSDQQ